jgi:long-chain acyl-CoA synthetase
LNLVPLKREKRYWLSMMWNFKQYDKRIAAISDSGKQITYNQLENACCDLKEQIGGRCLVFSLCTNSIGSIIGYTSFINNGIVPLLLNNHLESNLLETLIATYKPKFIWLPDGMVEKFEYETVYKAYEYTLLKTNFFDYFPLHDDLALLLPTSGSTGSPKLVRQSYQNIESNTKAIVEYLKLENHERPITTLPMYYTFGLSIINTHLYVGATVLVTDKTLMDKNFWNFFKEQEATSLSGVPYTFEVLDRFRFFRMGLTSLKTMTQAGGKLSPELHKKFAEYAETSHIQFVVMYGQTEATARMSYLPPEKALEKYGSIGIAIPGGNFSLVEADGSLIKDANISGELVYEGPNVTLGYAERGEDLSKSDENFGSLVTGDMAKIDEDGYYYIVGRKKRFLKIFGNRVNLDEIERIIKSHFTHLDCACTGFDDNLYVFITNEEEQSNVKKYLSEKTGLNSVAFKIKTINSIPRNESGKILYLNLEVPMNK